MANEIDNILKILIENRKEKCSIRKLSKLRRINYKSAYNAIMKLRDEGIINLEKFGNTTSCSFNLKFNPRVFNAEYERKTSLLKSKNFEIIHSRLNEIPRQFIVLLFGSYAKRTYDKHSDIDLLIIGRDLKEVEEAVTLIPLKIHLTLISENEFLDMAKSREFSVVSEAMEKNIILLGIENYYRLLENAE